MHYCGIIIKPKDMSVEDARDILGEELVKTGHADWYSTDDYRERTFDKRQEITIKEFNEKYFADFFEDIDPENLYPIVSITDEGYWDEGIIPHAFWEYHVGKHNDETETEKQYRISMKLLRQSLLVTQQEAYVLKARELFKQKGMMVTLVDYHN